MATATRLSTVLLLPLLFVSSSAHNKPAPSLSCDVKSICLTAPFPDLCEMSTSLLSPYGASELPLVIRGVLGLSISVAMAASLQVEGASSAIGVGGTSSATGCDKCMQTAVEVLEGAMKEVNSLSQPESAEYARRVSSVQTQVSKAVTSSNDCLKVLRGVPSGLGPPTVSVEHTMKLSSNLLVFVEKLQLTVQH